MAQTVDHVARDEKPPRLLNLGRNCALFEMPPRPRKTNIFKETGVLSTTLHFL